jgi:nicotinate-nucleotide adenylyltransferase
VGVGLFGGAFDPPHNGHVAVVAAAKLAFDLPRLVVLVAERPGHKDVHAPADVRLELARAAFPDDEVRLDPYARTVDLLRAERFDDPLFIVGADQLRDFPAWKEPEEVLRLARLAVATRPGYPREQAESERILYFEVEPNPAASRAIRAAAAAGEPLEGLVPEAVARLIRERGLYRPRTRDTLAANPNEGP